MQIKTDLNLQEAGSLLSCGQETGAGSSTGEAPWLVRELCQSMCPGAGRPWGGSMCTTASTDGPRMGALGALQAESRKQPAALAHIFLPSPGLLIPVLPLTQPRASIRLTHPPHWSSNSLSSRPFLRSSPLDNSTPFPPKDPSILPPPGSLPCLLQPPPLHPPLISSSSDCQGPVIACLGKLCFMPGSSR